MSRPPFQTEDEESGRGALGKQKGMPEYPAALFLFLAALSEIDERNVSQYSSSGKSISSLSCCLLSSLC